ncbi:18551_t:CDS:2 [Dentiscutata erythropus]|uniref:18551_t:CDS:1 n=1 Tax=Dentiscutata erythropus TaxID=1348616 RepID=A0A9N9HJC6_9GLOM|nr:18551_t:CDS:2 [Dentiscutata erythropus]
MRDDEILRRIEFIQFSPNADNTASGVRLVLLKFFRLAKALISNIPSLIGIKSASEVFMSEVLDLAQRLSENRTIC